MALKDKWKDKKNGVDVVDAEDINNIAREVIDIQEKDLVQLNQYIGQVNEAVDAVEQAVEVEFTRVDKSLLNKVDKPEDGAEFVKTTDYATDKKAGVVIAYPDFGMTADSSNGALRISHASVAEIQGKENYYKPLTPSDIDSAVMVGITTNALALNDEQKASAQEWLGLGGVKQDVEILKEAADGKLYDFKELTVSDNNYFSVQPEALGGYMISLLGGYKSNFANNVKNLVLNLQLPYFAQTHETLSFSFDATDGTLVLNGTMQAGEEFLIPYSLEIDQSAYSSKIFYHSGTIVTSGADTTIRFRITPSPVVGEEEFIDKTVIKNGNTTGFSLTSSLVGEQIRSIVIAAPDGATFTNYKFNLAFCVGDTPETYVEPSFLEAIQSKPKSFFIEGKNRWNGAAEATGTTSIDFYADEESPIPAGEYTLFLDRYAEGSGGSRVEFNFSDGSVIGKTSTNGAYEFTAATPLNSFKVFAKSTAKNSEGITLIVKNVMILNGHGLSRPSEFIPYHDDITVKIPEYLRSLEGYGVAVNPYNYNKIDLDEMYYTKNCTLYTIDGNTNFEEVEEGTGIFALSDVKVGASDSYFTSGLFTKRGEYEPFSIWYDQYDYGTEKLVVMMGAETTLEELKAIVTSFPFHLGVVKTATKYTLSANEILAGNCEIHLPVIKGDTVTIIGDDGNPTNNATVGYIYQRKI